VEVEDVVDVIAGAVQAVADVIAGVVKDRIKNPKRKQNPPRRKQNQNRAHREFLKSKQQK
jgi:hypothetical protein